jgi:hypothetical protein
MVRVNARLHLSVKRTRLNRPNYAIGKICSPAPGERERTKRGRRGSQRRRPKHTSIDFYSEGKVDGDSVGKGHFYSAFTGALTGLYPAGFGVIIPARWLLSPPSPQSGRIAVDIFGRGFSTQAETLSQNIKLLLEHGARQVTWVDKDGLDKQCEAPPRPTAAPAASSAAR